MVACASLAFSRLCFALSWKVDRATVLARHFIEAARCLLFLVSWKIPKLAFDTIDLDLSLPPGDVGRIPTSARERGRVLGLSCTRARRASPATTTHEVPRTPTRGIMYCSARAHSLRLNTGH